jgi:hypothetical protein
MNFDCDIDAAFKCESEFLNCKLFSGPADDAETLCKCGELFYGDCLRKAGIHLLIYDHHCNTLLFFEKNVSFLGCQTYEQVDELSDHQIYMKLCVNHIINNNCPSSLMCAMNCASDGSIDPATSKIIPFNNYGIYYLRIRICLRKIHQNKLARYSVVDAAACDTLADYDTCSRWIPPMTFVPVALPINTTAPGWAARARSIPAAARVPPTGGAAGAQSSTACTGLAKVRRAIGSTALAAMAVSVRITAPDARAWSPTAQAPGLKRSKGAMAGSPLLCTRRSSTSCS